MIAIGDIGIVLIVLGIVMLCASIAPTSIKADLRNVGGVFLIVGAIIYVLILVLG